MKKYWAILRIQLSNNLAYPVDLLSRSISIVFFMWVFAQLWRATYASTGQQTIAGLTLHDTLWYLMLSETILLSKPRLARAIAEAVKDGSIAYVLNKPYNFLVYYASVGLGDSLVSLVFNILAGGTVVWIMVGPPPSPAGWPFVLITVVFAWLIDFCISAMIGLAAFITEDVAAFEWIYSKILFLLGGLLIPLDFFPAWLRTIAQATPFAYTLYGPARLFVTFDWERLGTLLFGQMLWLAVLGLALGLLFRRGVAWLTINGG